MSSEDSLTSTLASRIADEIAQAGGWIGFDRFMEAALYTPGLGYYANDLRKFGAMPQSGSDFVTAPEMTRLFGQTLADFALEIAAHIAAKLDEIAVGHAECHCEIGIECRQTRGFDLAHGHFELSGLAGQIGR